MINVFRAAVLLAVLPSASIAAAQDRVIVTLTPQHQFRWDVGGYADWFGGNKSDAALEGGGSYDGGRWYDAASLGASTGYYWTPHLKVEGNVSTSTEGKVYVFRSSLSGQFSHFGEQHIRSTRASGGLAYQFLENTWFHPFLGGGLEIARETARTELREQMPCARSPCPLPVVLPTVTATSFEARPFVTSGFKAYMSQRAFFRSDVRVTASNTGAEAVVWRAGFGVDF